MDIEKGGGGLLKPAPIKTHLEALLGWGIKITYEKFFKMGFETKNYHFCILFAQPAAISIVIFNQKYEKVLKITQNVPKATSFGFRISI